MGINTFYLVLIFLIFRFPINKNVKITVVLVLSRFALTFLALTLVINGETMWVILSLFLCCLTLDSIALSCSKDNYPLKVLSAVICAMTIWMIVSALELDLGDTLIKSEILPLIERIWLVKEKTIESGLENLVGAYISMFIVNDLVLFILGCSKNKEKNLEQTEKSEKMIKMGKWIGPLERAIMYILIVTGNLGSIGFVIAAKALARFKELENKDFAEYFLVGTLSSVAGTLVVGFLFK